jgi:hypothetical protein
MIVEKLSSFVIIRRIKMEPKISFWQWIIQLFFGPQNTNTTTTKAPDVPETITSTTTDTTTTKSNSENTQKRSLHIGINNYPGVQNDLRGCVNDANNWAQLLRNQYDFNKVEIVLDKQAVKTNVKSKMEKLVKESKSGDTLVITYSGHGSNVRDTDGDEEDFRDETWYLYDGHLIDDDIRGIIKKLPEGVKVTIISDSCHSGTVTRSFLCALNDDSYYSKPKFMPPEDDIEAIAISSLPVKKATFCPEENMKEILLSGCKSTEYSYDATIGGKPTGAFSYYAIEILKANPKITYEKFYKELRKKLPTNRYPQTPCLEGSEENKNSIMFG